MFSSFVEGCGAGSKLEKLFVTLITLCTYYYCVLQFCRGLQGCQYSGRTLVIRCAQVALCSPVVFLEVCGAASKVEELSDYNVYMQYFYSPGL